jgi:hypothetical protein
LIDYVIIKVIGAEQVKGFPEVVVTESVSQGIAHL